jgi:hypothetical protein
MKVRFAITVDIDPGAWANKYGLNAADVPGDVADYLVMLLLENQRSKEGAIRAVEVNR